MSTSRAGTILSRDGAPCLWDEFEGDQVANVCFHDKQLHEAVAAQFSERRVAPTEPEEIDSVSDVDDDTVPWRLATELESVREEVAGLRHLQRDMAELLSMLAGLQASFDAKNTSPASSVAASPSAGAVHDPVLATPAVDTPAEDLSTAADNFYEMDISTWKPILMKLSSFERRQYLSEKLLAQDSAHQRFQRRPFQMLLLLVDVACSFNGSWEHPSTRLLLQNLTATVYFYKRPDLCGGSRRVHDFLDALERDHIFDEPRKFSESVKDFENKRFRFQYAKMLTSVLMGDEPLFQTYIKGLHRIQARQPIRHAVAMSVEDMRSLIRLFPSWEEKTVLRLAWMTASRWSDIQYLTTDHFVELHPLLVLDWWTAPKSSKLVPDRPYRYHRFPGSLPPTSGSLSHSSARGAA
eukprot:gene9517-biopygen6729